MVIRAFSFMHLLFEAIFCLILLRVFSLLRLSGAFMDEWGLMIELFQSGLCWIIQSLWFFGFLTMAQLYCIFSSDTQTFKLFDG